MQSGSGTSNHIFRTTKRSKRKLRSRSISPFRLTDPDVVPGTTLCPIVRSTAPIPRLLPTFTTWANMLPARSLPANGIQEIRMKPRFLFSLTTLLAVTFIFSSQPAHAAAPSVKTEVRHDVSAALRDMASVKLNTQGSSQEMPEPRAARAPFSGGTSDPVAQQLSGTLQGVAAGLNFAGQSAQDTFNVFGFAFVPPDTNGAAGLNQYVQIVNVTIAVYSKSTG